MRQIYDYLSMFFWVCAVLVILFACLQFAMLNEDGEFMDFDHIFFGIASRIEAGFLPDLYYQLALFDDVNDLERLILGIGLIAAPLTFGYLAHWFEEKASVFPNWKPSGSYKPVDHPPEPDDPPDDPG